MVKFIFAAQVLPNFTEEQYVKAWQRGSAIIQRQKGAMGTILHRGAKPGNLLAIASWESTEARETAMQQLSQADSETQEILSKHEQLAKITVFGYYNESWIVERGASITRGR